MQTLILVRRVCSRSSRSHQLQARRSPAQSRKATLPRSARRLSNPLSDVWALFARFDLNYANGEVNLGDPKIGSKVDLPDNAAATISSLKTTNR